MLKNPCRQDAADRGAGLGSPPSTSMGLVMAGRVKGLRCTHCRDRFVLTAWQQDFIKHAAGRGMELVFLECQLCHQYLDFNPLRNSVMTRSQKKKKAEPKLTLKEKRAALEAWAKQGIELPKSYATLLLRMPTGTTLRLKGRDWQLHTVQELDKKTQIDRRRVLRIGELEAWAKSLCKVFDGAEGTQDEAGHEFAFKRLSAGISIGGENEDILFMDPSDGYSLWCLYPSEGGTVERLAKRLDPVVARLGKKLAR